MEKALAVANSFIKMALEAKLPVTQMKLQKLIFFAHGWHLAICDAPLVDETFEAWPYGPVIPSVYHEFKMFGVLGIDMLGTTYTCTQNGFEWLPPGISDCTGTVQNLLKKIWDVYGKYSGTQLSNMTHQSNTPWALMRDKYGDEKSIPIPNDLIKSYFKDLLSHGG